MYRFLDPPDVRSEKRLFWAVKRAVFENLRFMRKRSGRRSKSLWNTFMFLLRIFAFFLKITGYYPKGYGNAKTLTISNVTLGFPNLPESFNGFRILHLSDLHIDSIPGFAAIIIDKIRGLNFDICVLTGDYRRDINGAFNQILKPMYALSKHLHAPYGVFAVLGNHDTYLMAGYEKGIGVELLVNESVEIEREGMKILVTGTDDPYYYFTESAVLCLDTKGYDFKIALIHTPELASVAAEHDYDLYLCGHTHGGQICLKEGVPLISHQYEGRRFSNGLWSIGKMVGYTSRGVGVSGLPVRFNCPAEIVMIELRKQSGNSVHSSQGTQ